MKGSITKRGEKRYQIRLVLGTDENGRRITKSHTVHGTRKLAEAVRADMVASYEGVDYIIESKATLAAHLQEWLKHKLANDEICASTEYSYGLMIRLYVTETIGKLPLKRVTTADIRSLYHELKERGLSKGTRGLVHTVLLQAFEWAVDDRKIVTNPATKAKKAKRKRSRPENPDKEVRSFTEGQANAFLAAMAGFDHTFFSVALITGARPGELLGLRWRCINWETNTIHIERAMASTRGKRRVLEMGATKTFGSKRPIIVPPQLMDELRFHRERVKEMRRYAGRDWKEDPSVGAVDLVFPGPTGTFIPPETVRARFKAGLKRAELPRDFRLYDCRHTMATLLLVKGENIKVVSERLGHTNVKITLEVYVHVLPSMQLRAAERLGEIFYRVA